MKNLVEELMMPVVSFGSPVTTLLFKLERLRGVALTGSTPREWFFQLQRSFQLLEAIGSSRIEGNNTTILDYVTKESLPPEIREREGFVEIGNLEKALQFIEENREPIDERFICKLQKMAVEGLTREGDPKAGRYRDANDVPALMRELVKFINKECGPQYDLLKVSVAHHQFVWIHPFRNGNGRTARLLTYAMIVRLFNVRQPRLFNPTAVFCFDRNRYYKMLKVADSRNNEAMVQWCHFVLQGLLDELQKTEKLTDIDYVRKSILGPVLQDSLRKGVIGKDICSALQVSLEKPVFQASDLAGIWPNTFTRSRYVRSMLEADLIAPISEGARKYYLKFAGGPLMVSLVRVLNWQGFLPDSMMEN
ncbi:Fic family protein [Fibrobacter sp.]|uniref:Fic family protein n=1 Tax=Fibrobacter sp. TaxID=35828 RepID=UPI00388E1C6F